MTVGDYQLSVAICTYNGALRLPTVLACLQRQVVSADWAWEVIIVDNNSSDQTAEVISAFQSAWPSKVPLRYCFEPRQGTAYARQRAVAESRGQLIGFIDDDNLPNSSWVAEACDFAQAHPQVGAFGSHIDGQFDSSPPPDFERIQPFFAVTHRGTQPHRYERRHRVLPPAAGLVVRKQVWLNHVPADMILLGAAAEQRLAGEDLEALSHIQLARWEIWHNPAMVIEHCIPAWRLERTYLMSFFKSIGFSRHVTRMLNVCPWQRPLMCLLYAVNDTRKILRHLLTHRTRLRTDLVSACELQLYFCSLLSPLYIWRLRWSRRTTRH
ncbi:MAG: hormogonium polysaccharide biosynthesis glycosyltransferase HpsE [Cyanobacteria bacterium J06554_6]